MLFVVKQKTAYEMRISDWSSDVCSSDLALDPVHHVAAVAGAERRGLVAVEEVVFLQRVCPAFLQVFKRFAAPVAGDRIGERLAVAGRTVKVDEHEIGTASCRERVCQSV